MLMIPEIAISDFITYLPGPANTAIPSFQELADYGTHFHLT